MHVVTYHERGTKSTYPVNTKVELTPYGNILVTREATDPIAALVGPNTSLLSPEAASQLIGALNEALSHSTTEGDV